MVRTLSQLGHVSVGFDVDRLLTMRFGMPGTRYATPAERTAYLRRLIDRFENIPGIESGAFSTRLPLDPAYGVASIEIEGRPVAAGEGPVVGARVVREKYFRTMGIPIRSGRDFTVHDDDKAPSVVLVTTRWPRASGQVRTRLDAASDSAMAIGWISLASWAT